MNHRFTNVRLRKEVRVMSNGHYWFRVSMDGGRTRDYAPDTGFDGLGNSFSWAAPKYLIAETDRLIADGCATGYFVFYEHDQDGNRRYDNLRYHDPEHIQWWADHLGRNK